MERDVVPVVDIGLRGFDELQLLLRVIDERAELPLLSIAERVSEEIVDFPLDITGSILENVLERLVFSVKVGNEMLRGLGEIQDSGEVDDLGAGCSYCGK